MNSPRTALLVSPLLRHLTQATGSSVNFWAGRRFCFLQAASVSVQRTNTVSVQRTICTQRSKQQQRRPEHKQPVPLQRRPGGVPEQTVARKVKEAGRDFTYLIVVIIGLGVTGGLFYVIFQELFSSSSPSKIYGEALEKCRHHPEVIGVFGEPIKGYGETTRRGRRQHVSHVDYIKDGLKCMRLKFYIEGSEPRKQGTVHLEVKENPQSGKFEFRYIFVDIDTYPRRTIVIEDNRS